MGIYSGYPNSIYKNGGNDLSPFIDATADILEFDSNVNLAQLKIFINEGLKFGVLTGFVRKSIALDSTDATQRVATIKTDKYIIKSLTCCILSGNKSRNDWDNDFMCPVKFAKSGNSLLLVPEKVNGSASFSLNTYGNGSSALGYVFIE